MKKKFLFKMLVLVGLACQAINAEVDIFKIFSGLSNTFDSLSAKNGLLADLDEVLSNAVKFQAFAGCQARSLQTGKPYKLLIQVIKKPGKEDIKLSCGDYSVPLDSIKFMLDLIDKKVLGSADKPGLISSIIQILEGAGISEVDKIKSATKEIRLLLNSFEKVIDWLKDSLKVDPNAKAITLVSENIRNVPNKDHTGTVPKVITKNYYQLLEIEPNATLAEIKKAYRKLALKYHPDKNEGDKEAADKFIEITNALATLSDTATRKAYDEAIKSK